MGLVNVLTCVVVTKSSLFTALIKNLISIEEQKISIGGNPHQHFNSCYLWRHAVFHYGANESILYNV